MKVIAYLNDQVTKVRTQALTGPTFGHSNSFDIVPNTTSIQDYRGVTYTNTLDESVHIDGKTHTYGGGGHFLSQQNASNYFGASFNAEAASYAAGSYSNSSSNHNEDSTGSLPAAIGSQLKEHLISVSSTL